MCVAWPDFADRHVAQLTARRARIDVLTRGRENDSLQGRLLHAARGAVVHPLQEAARHVGCARSRPCSAPIAHARRSHAPRPSTLLPSYPLRVRLRHVRTYRLCHAEYPP